MQKKTNFIGGALKLKNLKPDKTLKKMKKIITSDIKSLKKEKQKNGEDKVDPEKLASENTQEYFYNFPRKV